MAHIVRAVRHYGPRVVHNKTVNLDEISKWIEARTSLNKSQIVGVLIEISEAILFFNRMGSPLRLPGVGIFRSSIDRHGEFKINFRADPTLKKGLNAPGAYRGEIVRAGNAGLSDAAYKALWDADHPDDPLEV